MFSYHYGYYNYVWFFTWAHIPIFFLSNLFDYWFPYCIHLYTWSTQQVTVVQHMYWFFKVSNSPVFISINYFFPFLSIYGLPYLTFQFHLVQLFSYVLLTLILVGGMSRLCIFYCNCKGWSIHNSWSCWILWMTWHGRDTSRELNHLWILSWCQMDYISFGSFRLGLWHRADIMWWGFGYRLLSSYPGFLEPMLYALSSCYDVTITEQYLNFNSHHPYNVKKGIVRCLQHRAKAISCDIDAYQEEMISLRHNLNCNN